MGNEYLNFKDVHNHMAGAVPRSCSLQWLEGLARQCAPLPAPCQKWGPKEAGFQTGNLLQMKSKQQQDPIHRLRYPDRQLPFCLAGEKGQGWPGIKSRSLPCSPDQGQDKQMVSSKIRDRSEPKHVRLEESEAKRQRHKPRKMISWNPGDCFLRPRDLCTFWSDRNSWNSRIQISLMQQLEEQRKLDCDRQAVALASDFPQFSTLWALWVPPFVDFLPRQRRRS